MVAFLSSPFGAWAFLLLSAFLLYPLSRTRKGAVMPLFWLAQGMALALACAALWHLHQGAEPLVFFTAGFRPPLSIALKVGLPEAFLLVLLYLSGLGAACHFRRMLAERVSSLVLFLVLLVGASGVIMTGDLFNLYVFFEITALATIGLLSLGSHEQRFAAIFQSMTVEAVVSLFFLLGVGLIYHLTGTLMLSQIAERAELLQSPLGLLAQGFLAGAILLELKPLLANGPAINVYETTTASMASWLSVGAGAAMLMALYKVLPLLSPSLLEMLQIVGVATFCAGHLAALRQERTQRLLGYSSAAFLGLCVYFLTWNPAAILKPLFILLFIHGLAKMLLFFLADASEPSPPRKSRLYKVGLLAAVLALIAVPPLPSFGAKWELMMALGREHPLVMSIFLVGFFVEAAYLLRWMLRQWGPVEDGSGAAAWSLPDRFLTGALTAGLVASSLFLNVPAAREFTALAVGSLVLLWGLSLLPSAWARWAALLATVATGVFAFGRLSGPLPQLFLVLFTAGFSVVLLASASRLRTFYGLLFAVFLGGVMLLRADSLFLFFFGWEWMAAGTFLLILLGTPSGATARQYFLFALASAYFILLGFALQQSLAPATTWAGLSMSPWVWVPVFLGLAIELGLVGWHTWVAPSYRDAPHDFTPALAAVVNKAAVFGLLLLLIPHASAAPSGWMDLLVWLGLIGAFVGAFLALFEENFLTMLAYSSVGQMAYVIAALALMTHTGWVAALYLSINHFLYKTLLFIAAAAVIRQTGTPLMYQMGGLIKRMPVTFASVLIGIIAMCGVPPLGGFGGKWLLYNALMEKNQFLGAGLAFFASAVAFLYMYRILQTVFLGQLKEAGRTVREAPVGSLVAQILLIMGIMVFSAYPQPLMEFLFKLVGQDFPMATLALNEAGTITSPMGYWNPTTVMIVVACIFGALTVILLLNRQKVVWVKQFNMVFAGERPDRPETTHFAYDMYAHYRRALGLFCHSFALRFWAIAERALALVGEGAGRLNTGQTQDYLLASVALVALICLGGVWG